MLSDKHVGQQHNKADQMREKSITHSTSAPRFLMALLLLQLQWERKGERMYGEGGEMHFY